MMDDERRRRKYPKHLFEPETDGCLLLGSETDKVKVNTFIPVLRYSVSHKLISDNIRTTTTEIHKKVGTNGWGQIHTLGSKN